MAEFVMPILGADMQVGTLIAWRKQPGEMVHRGDIIAEVETDKANVEVESFLEGVVERHLVEPGEEVPVGTPLAIIRETAAASPASSPPTAAPAPPESLLATPPSSPSPTGQPSAEPAPPRAERLRVSPAARRRATELGVELTTVAGTGPGGRIQLEDIERAAAGPVAPAPLPAASSADARQTRMRQAIAAAMTRSHREIPQFHLLKTIDVSRALAWLATENEHLPVANRLLAGVLFIKATALALREVPELNAVWQDEQVALASDINVGVASALRGGGLVAPALHHADQRTLGDLMRGFLDLVQRARAWSLRASEMTDPTVTVTSLGESGADAGFGLIFPPQVALIGFGRIGERPWVVDGQVMARPLVAATLTADHRVVDGHRGSVFLEALDRLLQEPQQL